MLLAAQTLQVAPTWLGRFLRTPGQARLTLVGACMRGLYALFRPSRCETALLRGSGALPLGKLDSSESASARQGSSVHTACCSRAAATSCSGCRRRGETYDMESLLDSIAVSIRRWHVLSCDVCRERVELVGPRKKPFPAPCNSCRHRSPATRFGNSAPRWTREACLLTRFGRASRQAAESTHDSRSWRQTPCRLVLQWPASVLSR